MTASKIPQHVAIIMDGNGRWAEQHGLPRIEGHRRGALAVKNSLEAAQDFGVKNITLFAFSVENWNRPKQEVDALMHLLEHFLSEQEEQLVKRSVRLRVLGRSSELPVKIQEQLYKVEQATQEFEEFTVGLALNYGSRTEVVDAVKAITQAAQEGKLELNELDYDIFSQYLYTKDMPDPDLIIRTSGECRLSNFLLLQSAYSEIYLSDVLWPDFDQAEFGVALKAYASRERRFGKTAEQITK
ncbi:MAG: isoprenyl transferase [Verrucomicrobiota bacterium]|nr:isoprenyl transferase [Verrucomicrobiota bacterium]